MVINILDIIQVSATTCVMCAGVGILKTLCKDPEGVIPLFVIMLQSTSSFLWGCYALIIRNTFLTLSACISLTINVSSVIIVMLYRKKKRIRVTQLIDSRDELPRM